MASWTRAVERTTIPHTNLPAELLVPFFLWFVYMAWVTLFLCAVASVGFFVLNSKGRRAVWVYRRALSILRDGKLDARPAIYRSRRTQLQGYGRLNLDRVRSVPDLEDFE